MDKKILFTGFVSFVAGVFADRLFEKFGKKTVTKVQFKEPKNEEKNVDLGKLIEPYRGENGKIEGVRCGLVVFALKDADTLMNFDRACDYCRKVEIAGRATTLPRAGLEQKVAPYFEALNQKLESVGGKPLVAIKTDHKGYWADTASGKRGPGIAPWIIGFDNASSDIYGGGELCHVRPVMYLEGE